ncbi:hypothetical protein GCM10028819_42520 [Spirosoma humi]
MLAITLLQACKSGQLEPSTTDPTSTRPSALDDSLLNVVIPDFASIIKASVTPKGKLDHITTTYEYGNPGSENGVTINLLYNADQQVSGYTNFSSPSKGVDNAFVYEYENNKVARVFCKAINPNQPPFYFMEQWVYGTQNYPKALLLYRVELDGRAQLLSRDNFIYNSLNQLVEIKDANGYHMGQTFEYIGDSLQVVRSRNANGTFSGLYTEYQYDKRPNILKGVFLRFSQEYVEHSLNNNNLIRRTFKDNQTLSTSTNYTNQYDNQDRLIRRQSTQDGLGLVVEYYSFKE